MQKLTYILGSIAMLVFLLFSCTENRGKEEVVTEENEILPANKEKAFLDSLIKQNPNSSDLYFQRARYNFRNGINHAALADIYSAIHLDSTVAIYYYLGGDLFIEMGEGNKAVQLMSKGISLIPNDEELYLRAVEYNYYMGYHQSAINFANDLLQINKYNADAYFLKGMVYKELQDTTKAISNFQTCVEQDPEHYNGYMQLGLLLSAKKDNIALRYFDNALNLEPKSREAMYGKAYHHQRLKKFETAIEEYKNIVSIYPKDSEIYYNIGYCYIQTDSLEKAYSNFDIATKIDPAYAGAYYMKGYVSELAGNYPNAKFNYSQAGKMLPNDPKVLEAIDRVKNK
jgi:tetratricopeptide (TPR) repeat protein